MDKRENISTNLLYLNKNTKYSIEELREKLFNFFDNNNGDINGNNGEEYTSGTAILRGYNSDLHMYTTIGVNNYCHNNFDIVEVIEYIYDELKSIDDDINYYSDLTIQTENNFIIASYTVLT